jgi:protein SCO1/2
MESGLTRRRVLALAALVPGSGLAKVGSAEKAGVARPVASREPLTPRERIQQRYFPNVSLRTHEGRSVRFYDDLIKGKTVTLNVMYASCEGVCPAITMNLVRVQRLLGDRVGRDMFMYSITLKPEEDTPDVLKDYVRMHDIGRGWTFLTGTRDDIERLRRSLGFTNPNPALDQDASQHIGNVRYGNEPQMLWAACPGQAKPEWIVKSISWVLQPPTTDRRDATP